MAARERCKQDINTEEQWKSNNQTYNGAYLHREVMLSVFYTKCSRQSAHLNEKNTTLRLSNCYKNKRFFVYLMGSRYSNFKVSKIQCGSPFPLIFQFELILQCI